MQDRIFQTPNAVIVLDGASAPDPQEHDGGWIAEALGQTVARLLSASPQGDLPGILAEAIHLISSEHSLRPGDSPSTTISIVRWTDDAIDVLVLGDSPVIVQTVDGTTIAVRDDRLSQLAGRERFDDTVAANDDEELRLWRDLVEFERQARNQPGGYAIAEASPTAAFDSVRKSWPRSTVASVLSVTDGTADGIDRYGVPQNWLKAILIAQQDAGALVDLVHTVEESDPDGVLWPRSKKHDDKAAARVTFYL